MAKPRPTPEVLDEAVKVAKHNKRLIEFFREWEQRELSELPHRKENVAQGQGRCQLLQELLEFFEGPQGKG